jgi:serine/threonine protein kinase/Flp pilus assembly protein TadD
MVERMPVEFSRLEDIFAEAVRHPDGAPREAFLEQACGGDAELRREVDALLASDHAAGSFLELPDDVAAGGEAGGQYVALSEKPGTRIGRFELLEKIGEGGFGVVFKARQVEPVRRLVALKVIRLGMDTPQVVARFEAERQALALMDHPHVARVFDGGATDAGRPYFVMELVDGAPITQYCDEHRLTLRQRLELFGQVCEAVQHAHQKGLIHRDIKPTNLLVATHDDRPAAKVIDFGVAKAIGMQLTDKTLATDFRQLVGTPASMSPEQAAGGQDVDVRSDVYSLGVVLYELLVGIPPFVPRELRRKSLVEVQRILCEVEPPAPSARLRAMNAELPLAAAARGTAPEQLVAAVRGDLDWIVMRCLEKDRARRYESPSALARDVERYLHEEPVHASPPSPLYRARKFARRRRTEIAAAVTILLALISAAAAVGWSARDRGVRQAAFEEGVVSALDEVEIWYEREDWSEALAGVKHAERLVAAGGHPPELAARVRRWRADLETVERLDDLVLLNADGSQWDSSAAINAAYEREFEMLGIPIDALEVEEAAKRIRASRVAAQLTQALDHWAQFRLNVSYDERQKSWVRPIPWCRRPLAVARAADPDEYHGRVRQAIETWDLATLAALMKAPAARDLPVSVLRLAAREMYFNEDQQYRDEAREALMRAQAAHPNDFWLNVTIATHLAATATTGDGAGRATLDQAIPFATAAMALRAKNGQVRVLLTNLLMRTGEVGEGVLAEAEAICREGVAHRPKSASAHVCLGDILYFEEKFDGAAQSFRQAIALAPTSQSLHLKLGLTLRRQGEIAEAREAWRRASSLAGNDAWSLNQLAWILATASPEQRDAPTAVEFAKRAVELEPERGEFWNTLGVAHYRAGLWQAGAEALQKSMELRAGGDAADWLFLAMAHWQLDNAEEADRWYDKAVKSMDGREPATDELRRFRREAAALLGR